MKNKLIQVWKYLWRAVPVQVHIGFERSVRQFEKHNMSGRATLLAIRNRRKGMGVREAAPNVIFFIVRVRREIVQKKIRAGYDGDKFLSGSAEDEVIRQVLFS